MKTTSASSLIINLTISFLRNKLTCLQNLYTVRRPMSLYNHNRYSCVNCYYLNVYTHIHMSYYVYFCCGCATFLCHLHLNMVKYAPLVMSKPNFTHKPLSMFIQGSKNVSNILGCNYIQTQLSIIAKLYNINNFATRFGMVVFHSVQSIIMLFYTTYRYMYMFNDHIP